MLVNSYQKTKKLKKGEDSPKTDEELVGCDFGSNPSASVKLVDEIGETFKAKLTLNKSFARSNSSLEDVSLESLQEEVYDVLVVALDLAIKLGMDDKIILDYSDKKTEEWLNKYKDLNGEFLRPIDERFLKCAATGSAMRDAIQGEIDPRFHKLENLNYAYVLMSRFDNKDEKALARLMNCINIKTEEEVKKDGTEITGSQISCDDNNS